METDFDKLITEAEAIQPTAPEPDETEPGQTEPEPVDPEPVEPQPTPQDKQPEPEPEPVEQHDEEIGQQSDFTPRETALYAQAQRYKKQRQQSQDEIARLSAKQLEMQQQMVEILNRLTPQNQPEPEPDDYDPDEFVTGKQIQTIEERILKRMQERGQQEQQAQQQATARYLDATEQACARFYDDFETVVVPVIQQIGNDSNLMQKVISVNDPVKAAKLIYARAQELNQSKPTNQTTKPLPFVTKPAAAATPNAGERMARLTDDQINHLVSRLSSEDEINALLKMVGNG